MKQLDTYTKNNNKIIVSLTNGEASVRGIFKDLKSLKRRY